MGKMKKILQILIALFILMLPGVMGIPCGSNMYAPLNTSAEWTVLFYFDGDQLETTYSLSEKMLLDLENLQHVGSTPEVNLVVLMDLDGVNDSSLCYVLQDHVVYLPLSWVNASWRHEVNMGEKQTLLDFMQWGMHAFPADRYNVYLNNHGGGWFGICADEHPAYDLLNLTDLDYAFSQVADERGKPIDVVSMDACLMAMIEVAYQLKNDVTYLVASESFIHTHEENGGLFLNWHVDKIYQELVENPDMTAEDLCMICVDRFQTDQAYILPPTIIKPQAVDCISAIHVGDIETVAASLHELVGLLLEKRLFFMLRMPVVFLRSQSFSGGYDYFGITHYPSFVDLYDFAQMVQRVVVDRQVRDAAERVMESIEHVIVAERHGTRKVRWEHDDAHGLSIYFPFRRFTYSNEYESLDFAVDTNWVKLIQRCWLFNRGLRDSDSR